MLLQRQPVSLILKQSLTLKAPVCESGCPGRRTAEVLGYRRLKQPIQVLVWDGGEVGSEQIQEDEQFPLSEKVAPGCCGNSPVAAPYGLGNSFRAGGVEAPVQSGITPCQSAVRADSPSLCLLGAGRGSAFGCCPCTSEHSRSSSTSGRVCVPRG